MQLEECAPLETVYRITNGYLGPQVWYVLPDNAFYHIVIMLQCNDLYALPYSICIPVQHH